MFTSSTGTPISVGHVAAGCRFRWVQGKKGLVYVEQCFLIAGNQLNYFPALAWTLSQLFHSFYGQATLLQLDSCIAD